MTKREGQPWLVAGTLFISLFFLFGGGFETMPLFFAALLKSFHWSHAQTSSLSGALALSFGIACPLAGWLLDQFEGQIVMGVGTAAAALGFIIASRANSFSALLIAHIILGFGLGTSTWVPATMVVANWFHERRGVMIGIVTMGKEAGGSTLAIVVGYVIAVSGWRTGYLVLALPALVVVLPLVVFVVRTRPPGLVKQSVSAAASSVPGLELGEALRTRAFWTMAFAYLAHGLFGGGILIHLLVYLTGLGYSNRIATGAVSLYLGCTIFGRPLTGLFGDYIGAKDALAVTFLGMAVGAVLLLQGRYGWILTPCVAMLGLAGAGPRVLVPMVVAEALGLKRFGTVYGSLSLISNFGISAGAILVGWLFDLTGSYTRPFIFLIALVLFAAAASYCCVVVKIPAGEAIIGADPAV